MKIGEKDTNPNVVNAVNEIIRDIMDRRGFRQTWEETDDDIQEEIKKCWHDIIDRWIT